MNMINKISSCKACELHRTRRQVVIGRGDVPCNVLFIGEAPGRSEDLIGMPFVGIAGKLFENMIKDALDTIAMDFSLASYYVTNTVLCHPTDRIGGDNRQPGASEITACKQNILTIISIVEPKIICTIGKVADKSFRRYRQYTIQHPSFLLRQGGKASPFYQSNIQTLAEVFKHGEKKETVIEVEV